MPKHLQTLNKTIEEFKESKPYRLITQINRETGDYIIRLRANRVPDAVPVLIGDILQNCRSSLDLLSRELHIANGHIPPVPLPERSPWRRIQFPIFLDVDRFRKSGLRPTWGISEKARNLIEGRTAV